MITDDDYTIKSQLLEMLFKLSNYLDSTYFPEYDYYYNEEDMNANTDFPAICYHIGYSDDNSELHTITHECLTLYRNVAIAFYTRNLEPGYLEDELYSSEERLLEAIYKLNPKTIDNKLNNIKYVGTDSINTLLYHNLKQNEKEKFFVNRIKINFEFEYDLF